MRYSKLFCPTLKEVPKEAEVISHQLMLRAGMIQKVASGIYSYLPLGYRSLRKFEAIIREELEKVGCQEVHLPTVIPAELWKKSERWDKYGPELLRIKDRHDNEFCYGPTHEEVITDLLKRGLRSVKQLPINLYQIQTKFRDEIRPRFGLMRGREFRMKDAYSFHSNQDCLDTTYDGMAEAYKKIFERCGLQSKVVDADNGDMGGSGSSEFMVTAQTGEDAIVECPSCNFAANTELVDENTLSCPKCGKTGLRQIRGIEVGHIFKLGDRYSASFDFKVPVPEGGEKPVLMGCYGIGVGRTVAAAIEQHHDDKGIVWPEALAPFEVNVMILNMKDASCRETAEGFYQDLKRDGIDALLDDRNDSPGIKFKDAELIGFPYCVVFGKTFNNNGNVELISRKTGEKMELPLDKIKEILKEKLAWNYQSCLQ